MFVVQPVFHAPEAQAVMDEWKITHLLSLGESEPEPEPAPDASVDGGAP